MLIIFSSIGKQRCVQSAREFVDYGRGFIIITFDALILYLLCYLLNDPFRVTFVVSVLVPLPINI